MKRIARIVYIAAALAAVSSTSLLTGCAATSVAISKHSLDVQTKMSDTIFLEPTAEAKRTVFVQVRNTSDKADFDIASDVSAAIAAKGYRVVTDPDKAQFILQANILQVGKVAPTAAQESFGVYGSALGGAFLGAGISAAAGTTHVGPIVAAGLIGGLVETVANAAVKDVYFSAITDVQIRERTRAGVKSRENSIHAIKQGRSGGTVVTSTEDTDFRTYQTRVMSVANKVNLDFSEAAQPLRSGLVRVISGVF
ncbi:complement resistance protein TraT [Burkholderia ubonensis]|uniref:complement resistance protein TraT n=1 Tax=Burkholderia ubonensis TaxID=101571 RepID=UPI000754D6F4|nr:complement resistance protein TraT [Burkholderia ubonensis]KVP39864.1 conjugal transfer protein TraT [Burkholderia ubonensis]